LINPTSLLLLHDNITIQKVKMKSILATALVILATSANASVLFALSPDPNGFSTQKSWVVDRWKCHDLAADEFDNQASWAFVEGGLANGCELYEYVLPSFGVGLG
jgi:hypothetical protein